VVFSASAGASATSVGVGIILVFCADANVAKNTKARAIILVVIRILQNH
jgi:hypothetical protein